MVAADHIDADKMIERAMARKEGKMDLRKCSHGVPHEYGSCEQCKEIAELRAELERIKVHCGCHRIQAVDRGNSYQKAIAEVEQLTAERDRYRMAMEWAVRESGGGAIYMRKGVEKILVGGV